MLNPHRPFSFPRIRYRKGNSPAGAIKCVALRVLTVGASRINRVFDHPGNPSHHPSKFICCSQPPETKALAHFPERRPMSAPLRSKLFSNQFAAAVSVGVFRLNLRIAPLPPDRINRFSSFKIEYFAFPRRAPFFPVAPPAAPPLGSFFQARPMASVAVLASFLQNRQIHRIGFVAQIGAFGKTRSAKNAFSSPFCQICCKFIVGFVFATPFASRGVGSLRRTAERRENASPFSA